MAVITMPRRPKFFAKGHPILKKNTGYGLEFKERGVRTMVKGVRGIRSLGLFGRGRFMSDYKRPTKQRLNIRREK
jgi:hypothetical protein